MPSTKFNLLAAAAALLFLLTPSAHAVHHGIKAKYYRGNYCKHDDELHGTGNRINAERQGCWGVMNPPWDPPEEIAFRSYQFDWGKWHVRGAHKHDTCEIKAYSLPGTCDDRSQPVHVYSEANARKNRKICVDIPRDANGIRIVCHKKGKRDIEYEVEDLLVTDTIES